MERAVKERLVGAIILVALAVIFVPILFDGDGRREFSRIQVEMPEPPALVFGQHFPVLDDEGAPVASSGAEDSAAAARASTMVRAITPPRPPVVAAPPTPPAQAPPARTARPASPLDLWVVQTGVYGMRKNADAQRAKLRKAGFDPVFYKRHQKRAGEVTYSVRIGPYKGRAAAAKVAGRVRREHRIEALVKAYGEED